MFIQRLQQQPVGDFHHLPDRLRSPSDMLTVMLAHLPYLEHGARLIFTEIAKRL
jgi:hypothetical protein